MKKYYRNSKQSKALKLWEQNRSYIVLASAFLLFLIVLITYLSSYQRRDTNTSKVVDVNLPIDYRTTEYLQTIEQNRATLEKMNLGKVGVFVDTAVLYIDGEEIATLRNEHEANQVLDYFRFKYVDESSDIIEVSFVENVEIRKIRQDMTKFGGFASVDEAKHTIELGTAEVREHVVGDGENYWIIAQNYGITMEELEEANPEVDPLYLMVGQRVRLVAPRSLLTVVSRETIHYSEDIDYEVVYENSDNYYLGESRVKNNGVYGEKAVSASLLKQNGQVISRSVLEETILSEPVDKVVYVGTKDPPPRMGTGVLGYPLAYYGSVSSEFGETWGRAFAHTGIDVMCGVGTPVLASDGGTVIASGWSSSYGYRVIIDHGGNIQTLYAHCSEIAVSVGEQVFKGQVVAYSGNTGYSTGPHLHFEVRLNGVYQNPRYYLDF